MSTEADTRCFLLRPFVSEVRPSHVVVRFHPTHGREAIMPPHEFVLRKPRAAIKVRCETTGGGEGALLRRGGLEFINTSSTDEWYLASEGVGPRHADIYWDGRDDTIKITPVSIDGGPIRYTVVDTAPLAAGEHKVLEVGSNIEFGIACTYDPFACWTVASIDFGASKKTRAAGYEHYMNWAIGGFFSFCISNLTGIALLFAFSWVVGFEQVFNSIGRWNQSSLVLVSKGKSARECARQQPAHNNNQCDNNHRDNNQRDYKQRTTSSVMITRHLNNNLVSFPVPASSGLPAPTPEKTALQNFHKVADSAAGLLDRIQYMLYSAIAACHAMIPPGKFVIAFSLLVVILGGIWVYRGLRSRTYDTPDDSPAAPNDIIDWETKIRIAKMLLDEKMAVDSRQLGRQQAAGGVQGLMDMNLR
ncbi:hypothetical protein HDK77DRAFT_428944 [Phyllosticta capitalensis]